MERIILKFDNKKDWEDYVSDIKSRKIEFVAAYPLIDINLKQFYAYKIFFQTKNESAEPMFGRLNLPKISKPKK